MRFTTLIVLLFTASLLGACGGGSDDVEVVLPFVGNVMAKSKAKEETMASRGTLVLPPAIKSLPAPVTKDQIAGGKGWVSDPDAKAKSDAQIAALKEKQYRKDGDWKGERNSGNGLEDFNNKIDWSKRQTGVLQGMLKQE